MFDYLEFQKKRYNKLIFLILIGTRFLGVVPFSTLFPSGAVFDFLLFVLCLLLGLSVEKSIHKFLLYSLFGAYIIFIISASFFKGISYWESVASCKEIYPLFFFFAFAKLNPSICEVEMAILKLGLLGLALYLLQRYFMNFPFLESLANGWRTSEYDRSRYTVTGGAIIYLMYFMFMAKSCFEMNRKTILLSVSFFIMVLYNGYISVIVSAILSTIFLYVLVNKDSLDKVKFIILLLVGFAAVFVAIHTSFFSDTISHFQLKYEMYAESGLKNLDRAKEFDYYYNSYIKNFWEWLWGPGFNYGRYRGALPDDIYRFLNWADLGFIGFSFMAGLLQTFFWIALIAISLIQRNSRFYYINAFALLLITASLSLNFAMSDCAMCIEALLFYLTYKVNRNI